MIPWLDIDTPFPSVELALTELQGAAGLLAVGADLSSHRLIDAYRQGIFPWFSEGQPILWWSTDPRMVLYINEFKLSTSLKKTLKKMMLDPSVEFKFDCAFESVMRACAGPRKQGGGTWISEKIINAYVELHRLGYAHSSEVWVNGQLVGGAYGVCIGRMFYGESMFSHINNGSKIALAQLVFFLSSHNVQLIDCQQQTSHLASLGAVPISRRQFIEHLNQVIYLPPVTGWKS